MVRGALGAGGDQDGGGCDIILAVAAVEEGGHFGITRGVGCCAELDADQAQIVAHGAGDEVVAGGVGVAGFDAVGAGVGFQQIVVIFDHLAMPEEAGGAEDGVLIWEIGDQMAGEEGEIIGGGDLIGVGQTGGVAEGGVGHAERVGAEGHHFAEVILGAAHEFAECAGGIVGGTGDQGEHGLVDGDLAAWDQAEFGGFLASGVGGNGNELGIGDTVVAEGLEGEVEGHHLGEGRGIMRGVGVIGGDDAAC